MRQGPFPQTGLCCPGRHQYYDPIRLPSGWVRLPLVSVIRTRTPGAANAGAGEGLLCSRAHLLPIPLPLPRRVPRRLHLQVFSAFRGLRRDSSGSAPPCSPCGAGLTGLQDSRDAAGWAVAPPKRALDAALRRQAFPPDAGSLLPGLLVATRTGLAPAGGHKLARGSPQGHHLPPQPSAPRFRAHRTTARFRARPSTGVRHDP